MSFALTLNRRGLGLSLGALALDGCAINPERPVMLNFANQDQVPPDDGERRLETGADSSRRMTAPVRINGLGPFVFVVDTGANRTVLATELAAELGLPSAGATAVHGVSGVETAALATIHRLDVSALTARGLQAPTLPRHWIGADGLLGVDVLKTHRVVMDFVRNQLRVGADRATPVERSAFDMRRQGTGVAALDLGRRIVVPARYRFGQLIIVGADVAGRRVTALLDSGSQSTVGNSVLRRMVYRNEGFPNPVLVRVPILSATGQTSEGELGVMPVLKIGGLTITNLSAAFADLHVFDVWNLTTQPSLLLGMDVMRKFSAIELNYPRQEVAFYLRGGAE